MTWLELLTTGVVGAISVAATDGVATRLPVLNARPAGRAVVRLALAGAACWAAWKLKAPEAVVAGILVGPVLVTTLDVAVALIGRDPEKRLEPPVARTVEELGAPWAPQPAYLM
jgi:hypothetical protein